MGIIDKTRHASPFQLELRYVTAVARNRARRLCMERNGDFEISTEKQRGLLETRLRSENLTRRAGVPSHEAAYLAIFLLSALYRHDTSSQVDRVGARCERTNSEIQ